VHSLVIPGVHVYAGGYSIGGGVQEPGYWKNGSWHDMSSLSATQHAQGLAIAVVK
jgi:hypothetical protein